MLNKIIISNVNRFNHFDLLEAAGVAGFTGCVKPIDDTRYYITLTDYAKAGIEDFEIVKMFAAIVAAGLVIESLT